MTDGRQPRGGTMVRVWHYSCQVDNYEPARAFASGDLEEWHFPDDDHRPVTFLLTTELGMRLAHRAVYLLDDGETVRPFYVAGWRPDAPILYLHPFPTDQGHRPGTFHGWTLGPHRAYHLKIR